MIAVGNDRQFARLAELCGHPEWASDDRFATNSARVAHRAELAALVADCIRRRTAGEWFDALEAAGIPAGPINRVSEALAEVQAQHRQMVRLMSGGALGEVPVVGSPVRIDGERADSELPPPALGEHSREVLAELGLDGEAIDALAAKGVVGL